MSDYGDYSDEEDWLYVEDHYDMADVLAEQTCPSPPQRGMFEMERDPDYADVYDYWLDIEYLSDSYYEENAEHAANVPINKRKRKMAQRHGERPKKRRKQTEVKFSENGAESAEQAGSVVVWVSQDEREQLQRRVGSAKDVGKPETVALLKNWKEQFRDVPGLLTTSTTTSDGGGVNREDPHERDNISGEGFDLDNIQSVAGLLSEDNISTLKEALEAKGLDAETVEVVLRDLIEGRDPDLTNEDEIEEENDSGDEIYDKSEEVSAAAVTRAEALVKTEDNQPTQAQSRDPSNHLDQAIFKKPKMPVSETLGEQGPVDFEEQHVSTPSSFGSSDFRQANTRIADMEEERLGLRDGITSAPTLPLPSRHETQDAEYEEPRGAKITTSNSSDSDAGGIRTGYTGNADDSDGSEAPQDQREETWQDNQESSWNQQEKLSQSFEGVPARETAASDPHASKRAKRPAEDSTSPPPRARKATRKQKHYYTSSSKPSAEEEMEKIQASARAEAANESEDKPDGEAPVTRSSRRLRSTKG